jgi:hypothetical protein
MLVLFYIIMFCKAQYTPDVDNDTKRLCMEYAIRDHEKEIAPLRWEWLKTFGDPNDPQKWYESCINHVLKPVAR